MTDDAGSSRRRADDLPRLLLVEDNRDALVAGAHMLATAGFTVDIARSGADGIAKAALLRPDVIVTDLMMPDIGGEELIRDLRRHHHTRRTPIIVYTAVTEASTLRRLLHFDVRVFAIKPCLPTVIGAEARSLLVQRGEPPGIRVVTGYGKSLDELAEELRR